jgi:hypothetical protein
VIDMIQFEIIYLHFILTLIVDSKYEVFFQQMLKLIFSNEALVVAIFIDLIYNNVNMLFLNLLNMVSWSWMMIINVVILRILYLIIFFNLFEAYVSDWNLDRSVLVLLLIYIIIIIYNYYYQLSLNSMIHFNSHSNYLVNIEILIYILSKML